MKMKKSIIVMLLALPGSALAFCPVPIFSNDVQYNSILQQRFQECLSNERFQQQQLLNEQQQLQMQRDQLQMQRQQIQQQQLLSPGLKWNR
jgi:hypothetical protein